MRRPTYHPVAGHGLLVRFGEEVDDEAGADVVALDRALSAAPLEGQREVVPAYASLLVTFDPLVTDHDRVEAGVAARLGARDDAPAPTTEHEVTLLVDGDAAPDLPAVAETCGLEVDEVVALLLAGRYRVAMYGFAPGYAYLSGVDPRIHVPRKPTAVRDVPAGSVIVAGPQCLVTTLTMPTGWHVVGRSTTRVLRPEADDPFLFAPGDVVRFTRVDDDGRPA